MLVKLLGHEVEVSWISARQTQSLVARASVDSIGVWFKLKEPIPDTNTIEFAIEIEPKEYTEETFRKIIIAGGEKTLRHIIDLDKKVKKEREKRNEDRKVLNKLVADLGDRIGVEYQLDLK